ncbi:hypothetical protein AAFF_G00170570 [Aldrovandia affinis]|uniref:Uncharacterized protein n=1 Tax=Aldrovandia affinis TaxID=143900 RepID=A0AAD7VX37_9TELE|nr:hypothetical protein AAFF_G00170570 [Aldrovandia affinis]
MGFTRVGSTRPVGRGPCPGKPHEERPPKVGPSTPSTPSIPLSPNRFAVLAGPEEGPEISIGMDLELASPPPYQDTGAADNKNSETMDVVQQEEGDIGGADAPKGE